jgi:diguanylate cyclase (GGDEF)-like protein
MNSKKDEKHQNENNLWIDEVTGLLDAVLRLSRIAQPAELYKALAEIVSKKFEADAIAIFIFDASIRCFRLVFNQGFRLWNNEFKCSDEFLNQLVENELAPMTSVYGDPEVKTFFKDENPDSLESVLWVPLTVQEKAVGLVLLNKTVEELSEKFFGIEFLKRICSHAAISISSCRLYEQRQQEKEDLDKTLNNLSLLYNIGRAMTYISDLKSLLKYILNQAIEITISEKGSIMLYDPDTNQLSIRVLAGLEDEVYQEKVNNNEIKCKTFVPGEGVAGTVFETGEPIIINKTADNITFIGSSGSYARSIACVPMKVYKDTIGVINVTNKRGQTGFTDQDIEMLRAVADQAAISISKAQLWEMAVNDSLTGLHVRRYFMAKLQDEILRTDRYKKTLSIIMADLDKFKKVNDTYGHTTGDRVLKSVGAFLKDSIRDVDSIGRYGGEEFIMFLPETSKEAAFVLADRLRIGVSAIEMDDKLPKVTISLGISTFPEDGKSLNELLDRADAALYQAKENGRNQVICYTDDISLPNG